MKNQLIERSDGFRDFSPDFVQAMETRSGKAVERRCGDADALFDFAGSNYVQWKRGWNISSPWDAEKTADENDHRHNHGLKERSAR